MHEQNFNALLNQFTKEPAFAPTKNVAELQKKNAADIEEVKASRAALRGGRNFDNLRVPTEEDLQAIGEYAASYKRLNKKASKREVRKAVQEHFNIRIFRKGKLTKG